LEQQFSPIPLFEKEGLGEICLFEAICQSGL